MFHVGSEANAATRELVDERRATAGNAPQVVSSSPPSRQSPAGTAATAAFEIAVGAVAFEIAVGAVAFDVAVGAVAFDVAVPASAFDVAVRASGTPNTLMNEAIQSDTTRRRMGMRISRRPEQ